MNHGYNMVIEDLTNAWSTWSNSTTYSASEDELKFLKEIADYINHGILPMALIKQTSGNVAGFGTCSLATTGEVRITVGATNRVFSIS